MNRLTYGDLDGFSDHDAAVDMTLLVIMAKGPWSVNALPNARSWPEADLPATSGTCPSRAHVRVHSYAAYHRSPTAIRLFISSLGRAHCSNPSSILNGFT